MHRGAARQADRSRPQGIVGGGQQQLVAIVEQGIGGHDNQLAGAIAQVNVVQRDALNALLLGVVHHRLARRKNAFAVRIRGGIGQVADHVLLDFFGRIKAKHREVADVQFDDFVALFLHLTGPIEDRSADVVTDIGQLAGFLYGFQSPSPGLFR